MRWGTFVHAATTPSLPALAGAILVALALAFGVASGCGESLIRHTDYHLFMANPWDDHARLTALSIQGAARHAGAWTVCFLGASEVREGLEPDDFWPDHLRAAAPAEPTSVTLAANAMRRDDAFAVLDRFGCDFSGIVVLPTSLQSLSVGPGERSALKYLLGFSSPALGGLSRGYGLVGRLRMGASLLYHQSRFGPAWLTAAPVRTWDRYHFEGPATDQDDALVVPADPSKMEANLRWIGRTVERVRRDGRARVVLLEVPRREQASDSVVSARRTAELEAYRVRLRTFAAQMRVPWIDVTAQANLRARDFTDRAHLGDAGARWRFSECVAQSLSREITAPSYSPLLLPVPIAGRVSPASAARP